MGPLGVAADAVPLTPAVATLSNMSEDREAPTTLPGRPLPRLRLGPIIVGIVVVLGIGWAVNSCTTSGGTDVSPRVQARITCHDGVENLLKNPSTATYSNESLSGTDTRLTLTGTVVAENALGGKVTSAFTCDYYDNVAHVRIASR